MTGEFRAVYVSRKKVHVGSWLKRTRELFALDCTFRPLDGSGPFIVRIHSKNPIVKSLQLKSVYRFEEMGHVGFKPIKDVVTEVKTGTVYRIGRG